MKIFHAADVHYCPKHLQYVDKAFTAAVDIAIREQCDIAIIAGDLFDASMGIHEPAYAACATQVKRLSDAMPTLLLQGTPSHDRPGALDSMRALNDEGCLAIVTQPQRLYVYRMVGLGYRIADQRDPENAELSICCLPSVNKAAMQAMDVSPSEWVEYTLAEFGADSGYLREQNVPSILVAHGTVTGSQTESGFAMVSPDHEFSVETLLSAECRAVMLGHIHKHQAWQGYTPAGQHCQIAYSGSTAKLVHGQHQETGVIIWDLGASLPMTFHPIESRHLWDITFDGPPDMEFLAERAAAIPAGDHVRLRWVVDQEHAHTVDKDTIRDLFRHCSVKLEGTINPIQSIRAGGISRAHSTAEKLALWVETTGDADSLERLLAHLERIGYQDPQEIAASVIDQLGGAA